MAIKTEEKPESCTAWDRILVCADLDEDCDEVVDHLACWMYDMGRGRCPWCSMPERK